jgi:2,3-bisphosphoglycerate-independent phosphoglycerate mutase
LIHVTYSDALFITSDHGNAEKMYDDEGKPFTAHTTARVPFIMTSRDRKFRDLTPKGNGEGESVSESGGALCDVAPTILQYMGLDIPKEMTGESLLA